MAKTLLERFMTKFVKTETCWLWTGALNDKGYGWFNTTSSRPAKPDRASRVAYRLFIGEIPKGMCVCHKCDNPKCVNPDHLFLGTRRDNMIDKISKNRMPIGESTSWSKLTEQQVREIRESTDYQYVIAEKYGICQQSVSSIKRGINWKHLKD